MSAFTGAALGGCDLARVSPGRRPPASAIADEELAVDQVIALNFIPRQQSVQRLRPGRAVGQEPDPHRGIDKHHYRVPRFRPAFSRRLGRAAKRSQPLVSPETARSDSLRAGRYYPWPGRAAAARKWAEERFQL